MLSRGRNRTELRGSRILLTGASSGIGRELAKRLAAEGAILALAARRRPLLEELVEEIQRTGAGGPFVLETDLSARGNALKAHCEKKLKGAEARLEKIVLGPEGAKGTEAMEL